MVKHIDVNDNPEYPPFPLCSAKVHGSEYVKTYRESTCKTCRQSMDSVLAHMDRLPKDKPLVLKRINRIMRHENV